MSLMKHEYRELTVRAGATVLPARSWTDTSLELDIKDAPLLRGFVMVFDGERLLSEAYIDAVDEARGFLRYVFRADTSAELGAEQS